MEINIYNSSQEREWSRALAQIPEADIYFTAAYCRIYEQHGEGIAQLFVYQEGDALICYPYLLRKLSDVPLFRSLGLQGEWYDVTTPYGYGGPITNVTDDLKRELLFANFSREFERYCGEKKIVTEFVRYHPILQNHHDYTAANPIFERNTVHIDLQHEECEIQKHYSRDNRNRIRKALKEGLYVKHTNLRQIDRLLELYYRTMDKKQANDYFYFPEPFFRDTTTLLEGNIELVEVCHGDKVVTSCLFMHYNQFVHYHLMGSDKEYLRMAPVNLLIHEAAMWAKSRGFRYLHLGGGYTGNDNLFRFKRSFNEQCSNDFYVGKKIHHNELYAWIEQKLEWAEPSGFFPIYRRTDVGEKRDTALAEASII